MHLADTLSRAPSQEQDTHSDSTDTFENAVSHVNPTSPTLTDTTGDQLRKVTASCPDMQLREYHIIHGWPSKKQHLSAPLQPFWNYRDELSMADGLLLKCSRAIVPTSLRPNILHKIHQSHRGHEYCLRFARDAVFWPSMYKDIEALCYSCSTCAKYEKQPTAEPMLSHPIPTRP